MPKKKCIFRELRLLIFEIAYRLKLENQNPCQYLGKVLNNFYDTNNMVNIVKSALNHRQI